MPLNQQDKLLRAIEENAIAPVGAASPVAVNVPVVAGTNVDLLEAVERCDGKATKCPGPLLP